MTTHRRGEPAPTRPAVTEEPSYDDLLAEIEQLRARLATGAEAYEQLRASYNCERAAHEEAGRLLKLATWAVTGAVTHGERMTAGRYYRIPGVVFDSLAGLIGYHDEEDEG